MSTATRDVPIDQLRTLPLRKRLQIMDALLDSFQNERGREQIFRDFGDEVDGHDEEEEADPSSAVWWEEIRTEIRTVFTHYRPDPRYPAG